MSKVVNWHKHIIKVKGEDLYLGKEYGMSWWISEKYKAITFVTKGEADRVISNMPKGAQAHVEVVEI